jgi:hypothetical protein
MRAFYSPKFSSIFLPSACSAAILFFTLTALPPAAEAQVTALDPNYTVSLLASGLQLPTGGFIYRPATNDLLVTQEDLGLVSRVDATSGAVSTVANLASYSISNRGHYVWELNVNSAGEIWVPLLDYGPVVRLNASGAFLGSFAIPSCGGAVAFDSQDNAYLGIGCPASIYEYPKGNFSSPTLYASGFSGTASFRFNKAGQMFVADRAPGIVYQVTPGGTSASSHTVWASGLTLPDGIAIDPITQYVYVGDESGKVTRITAPGVFSTFATGFSSAMGLGFDTAGNLYVGDKFVGAIWKFTRNAPTSVPTITPNSGGNAGNVTVRITGQGLESGATVSLSGAGSNIVGTNTTLLSPGILGTTFDLTNATPEVCKVVVNNPDGTVVSLLNGFTVQEGGAASVSVNILGLDKIRVGSDQTYYLSISNSGLIDAPFIEADVPESSTVVTSASMSPPLAPTATGLSPSVIPLSAQYVGPLPANSSMNFPFTRHGTSGPCITDSSNSRSITSGDPCAKLEAAKASVDAYLATHYDLRLANLLAWMYSMLPVAEGGSGICFNPQNRLSSSLCDSYEAIDFSQSLLIKGAEQASSIICGLEKASGCPNGNNCELPSAIDLLGVYVDSVKNVDEDLKLVFSLPTVSLDKVLEDDAQLTSVLGQVQSLPGSLPFSDTNNPLLTLYPPNQSNSYTFCPVTSLDPNDLVGDGGYGQPRWISGSQVLKYGVYFANDQSATAPAGNVTILSQLDPNKIDLNTLQVQGIALGSTQINNLSLDPTTKTLNIDIDLRPTTNLIVAVAVLVNSATGAFTANLRSLDPVTLLPPTDPTAGFLPPGAGGSLLLSAAPKNGLATGTVVSDSASIIFDLNTPISTPTWLNTVDNSPPTSHVVALPSTEWTTGFSVSWMGTDVGSGIQDYSIYISDNGGPFTPWLVNTASMSATYTGQCGHTYAFYSVARDLVGNVEAAKTAAEASTQVTEPTHMTPTVTLAPSSTSTTTTQALTVVVAVSGGSGNPAPTGSVTLTSGSFISSSAALSSGVATISISAGSLSVGTDTLLVTYTPDAASSSAYNSASGSTSVSVQGYPVITWPTPATITYGTPLSTVQLDATTSVAGSFTYVPPSGTVLNAGSQTLTVNFNPSDTTDYLPVSSSVTLLVNQASQTIAFTGLPAAATYGAAGPYTLNSTGGTSGNAVTYAVTGPASIAGSILTIIGAGTVTVTASQAGNTNYMAATPVSQTILVGKAASTTVLGAASTTPAQGTADLLKVTVTGAGQQPSGTVQFIAGTTALCTSTLSAGVATCSYVPSASGSVLVLAQYQGDTNHLGSSASLTLTVYDTAITLKVRKAELFYSERLEGEVCVASAIKARATGNVEIFDGTTLLATRELRRDDCTHWEDRSELSVGTHMLTAVYSGDNKNPAGISAPVTVTVSPVRVDLDVFCGDDRFPYGKNYDCKVSAHSHAGPAEGSITYSFDGAAPVTLSLSNGNAEFTITRPAVGVHTVVVDFAQQTNYAAADPQTREFTVTLAPVNVNLTMTPSRRTAEAGTSVTFQANVTSWSAGPPNATGSVSFYDGSNLLATVPVNPSGQADYATASLTIGYHTISAAYSGGANYAPGSKSVPLTITH